MKPFQFSPYTFDLFQVESLVINIVLFVCALFWKYQMDICTYATITSVLAWHADNVMGAIFIAIRGQV